jgi:RNA polymerase sigma-70 factor (ECF subfamily)
LDLSPPGFSLVGMTTVLPASDPAQARRLSFREIYDGHVHQVYGILYLRGVSEHDTRDLVQDVFLRVHQYLDTCEARQAPWKWLARITRNVARDHWKGRRNEASVIDHDADLMNVPDHDFEAARRRLALLRDCVNEIHNEDWREIILRRIEGQTVPEIADELGRPLNTVKSQSARAEALLKEAIDRHHARERRETGTLGVVVPIFGGFGRTSPFDVLKSVKAPAGLRDAVWERLKHLPDHGGGGGGPRAPAAPSAMPSVAPSALLQPAAMSWGLAFFGVACAAVLVAAGVALALLWDPLGRRSHGTHGSRDPVELRPVAVAFVASAVAPGPSEAPSASTEPAPEPSVAPPAAPAEPADTTVAEHAILDPAERDLRAHHVRAVLRVVEEHARLFPHGRLAMWRERLRREAEERAEQRNDPLTDAGAP